MLNRQTFAAQQSNNRRNSVLLIGAVTLLLAALGFAIGYGTTGAVAGAFGVTTGAIVLAMLLSVGSYFAGDKLVLATSGAREVSQQSAPQLMNVVQEMALSAGVPMPKVYIIEVANRATQHLYFTNPIKKFEERSSAMFSTHPAIVDRINRLRQLTGDPPLDPADVQALTGLD